MSDPGSRTSPRAAWRSATLALCALWLAAPGPAGAEELYRWIGRDGSVHFGAAPPADARDVRKIDPSPAGNVNIVPGGVPSSATAPGTSRDPGERLEALEAAEPRLIGGRPEAQWRRQARHLEREIERLEAALEDAEDRLGSSYGLRNAAYYQARVKRLERELAEAEQALEDFEDRAREAGVPPGWLR